MSHGELNATAGSLLGFLHEAPQSGWDLVATAQKQIGAFWTVTQSQVYRELATMAKSGLIETDEVGARDRRAYRLTSDGRSAFKRWLGRTPGSEQIRHPLLLSLAFARHLSAEQITGFVTQHRAIHAEHLHAYRQAETAALEAGADQADLITLDFGIRYESAVLEWLDHLPGPDRIQRPARTTGPPPTLGTVE